MKEIKVAPGVNLQGLILMLSQLIGSLLDLYRSGSDFPISRLFLPGNILNTQSCEGYLKLFCVSYSQLALWCNCYDS